MLPMAAYLEPIRPGRAPESNAEVIGRAIPPPGGFPVTAIRAGQLLSAPKEGASSTRTHAGKRRVPDARPRQPHARAGNCTYLDRHARSQPLEGVNSSGIRRAARNPWQRRMRPRTSPRWQATC